MPINTKQNDSLVELHGDHAHLYEWLEAVERVDEEEGTPYVEYRGPITVMRTTLTMDELMGYREHLIKFAPAHSTKEASLAYLANTDYMVIKCTELDLAMADEYPEALALRGVAREIVRLES